MDRETLKEYTRRFCEGCSNTQQDNSAATECGQCLEDFVAAVDRLYTPKPSTDFSIPKDTPYKDYLMYEEGVGWVVGFYDKAWDQFICVDRVYGGEIFFLPSHWLPIPPAPL